MAEGSLRLPSAVTLASCHAQRAGLMPRRAGVGFLTQEAERLVEKVKPLRKWWVPKNVSGPNAPELERGKWAEQ